MDLNSSLTTLAKREEVLAEHQEDHTYREAGGRGQGKGNSPTALISCPMDEKDEV